MEFDSDDFEALTPPLSQEELRHLRERAISAHGLLHLQRAGVNVEQIRAMISAKRIAREWQLVADKTLTEHDLQYLHGTEDELRGLMARLTRSEAARLLDAFQTWSDSDEDQVPPGENEFEPNVPGTTPRELPSFWDAPFTPGHPINKPPTSGTVLSLLKGCSTLINANYSFQRPNCPRQNTQKETNFPDRPGASRFRHSTSTHRHHQRTQLPRALHVQSNGGRPPAPQAYWTLPGSDRKDPENPIRR